VRLLGEGRAWSAIHNGGTPAKEARESFGQLAWFLSSGVAPEVASAEDDATFSFRTTWGRQLHVFLFAHEDIRRAEDIDVDSLQERIARNATLFDRFEEESVYRATRF